MLIEPLKSKGGLFFSFLILLICIVGCTNKDKPAKYRFYFRGDNLHEEQIIEINDLSEGFINPKKSSIALNKDIYYDLYYHKGTYYDIDHPRKIKKYILQNNEPTFQDSCVIVGMTEIETHSFVDDTTLLVIGLDLEHRNPVYAIINTTDFKISREGNIPIADDGSYQRTSIGFALVKDKVLYINYVYHNTQGNTYTTFPSIDLVAIDYPSMTPLHYSTNNKSTYTPKNGRHQPTMATDGTGTIFFITNTSIGFGNMENIPSGIMKVNTANKNIDENFFINISDSSKNTYPVAIWFISRDIFLVKCERLDLINSWGDYLDQKIIEYYTVNVNSGTFNKLNLPLDTPWYTNNVIIDNGIAYIANNANDGYTFWIFDPSNNSLQKGVKIDSSVKRIFSIDFN